MQINNQISQSYNNTKAILQPRQAGNEPLRKTNQNINGSNGVLLDLQARRGDDILRLIEQIFGHQTRTFNVSNGGSLREDAFDFMVENITPEQAAELISEDGFFGVERTSERLFNLAASFAGGDPEVMEKMRQAVIDGFAAAEAAWGGELPQISHDTLARTMERFDAWFELNI
ncbi:MAG: hypothetical protein FWF50_02935 [Defluviitaleaceae bacterium]|nr:hypothetical protein [Defluviitaleaceae bacterium]